MNFLKVFNKFTKWALQDKHIILLFLWPSIFLLVLTKYFVVAKSKQPGGQIPVKRQKKKKKKKKKKIEQNPETPDMVTFTEEIFMENSIFVQCYLKGGCCKDVLFGHFD